MNESQTFIYNETQEEEILQNCEQHQQHDEKLCKHQVTEPNCISCVGNDIKQTNTQFDKVVGVDDTLCKTSEHAKVTINDNVNNNSVISHINPLIAIKTSSEDCSNKAFIDINNEKSCNQSTLNSSAPEHNYCVKNSSHNQIETQENDGLTDASTQILNEKSEGVDTFQGGFVSSMIEVVDSVKENVENNTESSLDSDSEDESSDSDSSDSSTSTDTSSDDSCIARIRHEDIEISEEIAELKNTEPPKVKGEILNSELPPVEDLHISLPEDAQLDNIGKVSQIMDDHSVVIKSYENKPALDFKTVLFFARDLAIGAVEETFGPVPSPYYVVRFNSAEHIISKEVQLEKEVFYAPNIKDFTSFVFVSELKRLRGSDASWSNDREPPPSCIEYSDDEQEREARKQRKNQSWGQPDENASTSTASQNGESSQNACRGRGRGRGRGRKRDHWHNQSTIRMNTPDESQMAWQNAVNRPVGRNHNNMPSLPLFPEPPPYPLLPPPPMGGYMNPYQRAQVPPPPLGNYNYPPPPFIGWEQPRFQQSQQMLSFQPPPPPPPPE
uniref:H/ACA ribonucleoprotein complex non-core subunit NAF1-like n=1 Tax=Styela clava TaxID=7725 RepID=UPI00193A30F4|nr:H/ACA ribonucleoprotein complex non-core subunit NAF1-like [Styela clava]